MSDRRLIAALLDVMEWDRAYDVVALHSMFPGTSMDSLREALHALWIDRRVERVRPIRLAPAGITVRRTPAALVESTVCLR